MKMLPRRPSAAVQVVAVKAPLPVPSGNGAQAHLPLHTAKAFVPGWVPGSQSSPEVSCSRMTNRSTSTIWTLLIVQP